MTTLTHDTTANITVIDAIMGSGKTTWTINHLNELAAADRGLAFSDEDIEPRKFIYVAPTLSEVERIIDSCHEVGFREPRAIGGRKLNGLAEQIGDGLNVCTTHALFRLVTPAIIAELRRHRYVLVIDEALSAVELYDDLTASDQRLLFDHGLVDVDAETSRLTWRDDLHPVYQGRFNVVQGLCSQGSLTMSPTNRLVWEFPAEFLAAFEEVHILTYLFDGSPMASWLKGKGLTWRTMTVRGNVLLNRSEVDDRDILTGLEPLIQIYEGAANKIGAMPDGPGQPLSSSWFKRDQASGGAGMARLKASTTHIFRRFAGTEAALNVWTTFQAQRNALKGCGYSKGFIPINAKASNDWAHKASLAHLGNIFPHPLLVNHFKALGVSIDQDAYALSELVQWIWRSRIRNGEPIKLFIPSERMRRLLKGWLKTGRVEMAAG